MKSITLSQIKQIHTLAGKAKLSDDLRKEMLAIRYPASIDKDTGEATSKKLSFSQAQEFILELRAKLDQANYKKYEELGDRPGMAKPAQLRKIDAMWSAVTRQTTQKDRNKALNRWLDHHFHVSHMKFIEDHQVGKIVASLRAMKFQKERELG